jgi:membrane protein implicated in regulation of membrane protease activity
MFDFTRGQWLMIGALIIGFVLGKILKNFKVGFAIALVLSLLFAVNMKRK